MSVPKGEKVYAQLSINDGGIGVTNTNPSSTVTPTVTASVPVTDNTASAANSTPAATTSSSSNSALNKQSSVDSLAGLDPLGLFKNTSSNSASKSSNSVTISVPDDNTASIKTAAANTTPNGGYIVNSLGYTTMPDGTIKYVGTKGNTVVSSHKSTSTSGTQTKKTTSSTPTGVTISVPDDPKPNTTKKSSFNKTTSTKKTSTAKPASSKTTVPVKQTQNSNTSITPDSTSGQNKIDFHWNGFSTGNNLVDDAVAAAAAVPIAAAQTILGR